MYNVSPLLWHVSFQEYKYVNLYYIIFACCNQLIKLYYFHLWGANKEFNVANNGWCEIFTICKTFILMPSPSIFNECFPTSELRKILKIGDGCFHSILIADKTYCIHFVNHLLYHWWKLDKRPYQPSSKVPVSSPFLLWIISIFSSLATSLDVKLV